MDQNLNLARESTEKGKPQNGDRRFRIAAISRLLEAADDTELGIAYHFLLHLIK